MIGILAGRRVGAILAHEIEAVDAGHDEVLQDDRRLDLPSAIATALPDRRSNGSRYSGSVAGRGGRPRRSSA